MAVGNKIYPLYRQALLMGTACYNLNSDTVDNGPYCALVDINTYIYDAAHDFFNDLSGIVGTPQRITAPTVTAGTFDGGDLVYVSVTGPEAEALVVYRNATPSPNSTWPLVMYYDQVGGGLPVTPNGGNIRVTWNSGGIFTL
jgi:hypothetical protein